MSDRVREMARCEGFDVGLEDHGIMAVHGCFTGDGWGQGFGYAIDIEFVQGLLGVFGVDRLQKINGKPCWITHTHNSISKVEPLFKSEGTPFDVELWTKEAVARNEALRALKKRKPQ